mgnify:CR=1 FL=1
MSGESALHVRLVERLIAHIQDRHPAPRGLLLLADHHAYGANRPSTIDGFTPDVFASDLPATFEVIGEAKTPLDLESPRSARQLAVFLDYLALRPNSSFYLAVAPLTAARTWAVLNRIRRPAHAGVAITVIDGV